MEKIAIIGLGYVGLPVALAFARKFPNSVGFDIHAEKVKELARGFDRNLEVPEEELKASTMTFSCNPADLKDCTFFVVAVPTPVDENKLPDLTPVVRASETVAKVAMPLSFIAQLNPLRPLWTRSAGSATPPGRPRGRGPSAACRSRRGRRG